MEERGFEPQISLLEMCQPIKLQYSLLLVFYVMKIIMKKMYCYLNYCIHKCSCKIPSSFFINNRNSTLI